MIILNVELRMRVFFGVVPLRSVAKQGCDPNNSICIETQILLPGSNRPRVRGGKTPKREIR